MVHRPTLVRAAFASWLAVFATVLAWAPPARAEDAFVLDNGAVLRGTVLRENDKEVEFRLEGIGRDGRVTIEKSRIAQRFVTKEAIPATRIPLAVPTEGAPASEPALARYLPAGASLGAPSLAPALVRDARLPEEEPTAREEDFFQRTARRAIMAIPQGPWMRGLLVAVAILLLLALIEIGGRMVDVDGLSLGKSTSLTLLLGLLVGVDALGSETLLRADRAPVLIIAELFAWVGCAAGILRCGVAAAFQLLAFVLFAGALAALVTGAVLVSI